MASDLNIENNLNNEEPKKERIKKNAIKRRGRPPKTTDAEEMKKDSVHIEENNAEKKVTFDFSKMNQKLDSVMMNEQNVHDDDLFWDIPARNKENMNDGLDIDLQNNRTYMDEKTSDSPSKSNKLRNKNIMGAKEVRTARFSPEKITSFVAEEYQNLMNKISPNRFMQSEEYQKDVSLPYDDDSISYVPQVSQNEKSEELNPEEAFFNKTDKIESFDEDKIDSADMIQENRNVSLKKMESQETRQNREMRQEDKQNLSQMHSNRNPKQDKRNFLKKNKNLNNNNQGKRFPNENDIPDKRRIRMGGAAPTSAEIKRLLKMTRPGNSEPETFFDDETGVPLPVSKLRIADLQQQSMIELLDIVKEMGMEDLNVRSKSELVFELVRAKTEMSPCVLTGSGYLEIHPSEGYGFLRSPYYSYLPSAEDVYLSAAQVKKYGLRTGDYVEGQVRQPRENERFFAMYSIDEINHQPPELKKTIVPFQELKPYFPTKRIFLENDSEELSTRVVDLVTPIGLGQRGLIVAPPRTGKTVLLQKIANSILKNNPDVILIILLIDERPEEVTDMTRTVGANAEIVSSTFDEPPERHVQIAEMVIEKAKRLVECKKDVVILLDSITRLARAYNTMQPHSGKILTGGVDANALHKPKRFFGAARNIENYGSLTILATALIDTGSKMDEVIFEEFKGTGNMELHLDRRLIDKRVYPAINIEASGTRKEELLLHPDELPHVWALRRAMTGVPPVEAMEILLTKLKKIKTNTEFLLTMKVDQQ